MTGTAEFRLTNGGFGHTQNIFWHGKTAQQVRDEQHPGCKVVKTGPPPNRSVRHGVDYCQLYSVLDPGAGATYVATLMEVP